VGPFVKHDECKQAMNVNNNIVLSIGVLEKIRGKIGGTKYMAKGFWYPF